MTKCDFCKYSNPDGTCPYSSAIYRSSYCKKAIRIMSETLKDNKSRTLRR